MNEYDNATGKNPASDRRHDADSPKRNGRISFTAIVIFVLCLAITATLLIAAGVMTLADILDSTPLACLIAGGAAAIVSLGIYLFSIRKSVRIMRDYIDTVYDASQLARSGYERIKWWISLIFE